MSVYRLDKHAERKIAALLDGQRVGHLGGADVVADGLSVEVKTRKNFPAWLTSAMRQAHGNANDSQLAIVVLHEAGGRYDDAIVCIRLADFRKPHSVEDIALISC